MRAFLLLSVFMLASSAIACGSKQNPPNNNYSQELDRKHCTTGRDCASGHCTAEGRCG